MSDKIEATSRGLAGCAGAGCMVYLMIIVVAFLAVVVGGVLYTFATGQGSLY